MESVLESHATCVSVLNLSKVRIGPETTEFLWLGRRAPARRSCATELPTVTKIALLAAYVASHNPQERDETLFTKKRALSSNSKKGKPKGSDTLSMPAGPQYVQLDRLLSVHAYLAAEHTAATLPVRDPVLLSSLAQLCSISLLERAEKSPEDLSHLRFKCLLEAKDAHDLAASIRFPLGKYLPPK